jgi:hypothetical protein
VIWLLTKHGRTVHEGLQMVYKVILLKVMFLKCAQHATNSHGGSIHGYKETSWKFRFSKFPRHGHKFDIHGRFVYKYHENLSFMEMGLYMSITRQGIVTPWQFVATEPTLCKVQYLKCPRHGHEWSRSHYLWIQKKSLWKRVFQNVQQGHKSNISGHVVG